MIAPKTETRVTSTVDGLEIEMDFDKAATIHLMSVLTDLYSDPERAVLREYATNARDSHVEAGTSRPIEVNLPGPLAPFLTIKDYGVGLSMLDVQNIYSKYGASTKRGTNAAVGMIGLGCKSALSYQPQFTLTAVQDGTRIQVSISRDERGAGTMTVVDTSATQDPNGVEITIPVKRHHDFERKAKELFRFWEPGTVLVNGKEPEALEAEHVNDRLSIIEGRQSYVVMGDVPYPIDDDHFQPSLAYNHALVVRVGIGDVEFTPSREALHYTSKTQTVLGDALSEFNREAKVVTQRAIDAAPTHEDALAAMVWWHSVLTLTAYADSYIYKGDKLPTAYRSARQEDKTDYNGNIKKMPARTMVTNNHGYVLSRSRMYDSVPAESWETAVWITGYEPEKLTAPQKRKMQKWLEFKNLSAQKFILLRESDSPPTPWVSKERIVPWLTIKAIKLPRSARTTNGRIPGSFDCYVSGAWSLDTAADDLDTTMPLFWTDDRYAATRLHPLFTKCHPTGHTIVIVPNRRQAKFKRDFPTAQVADDAAEKLWDDWKKACSADDLKLLAMHVSGDRDDLMQLDSKDINDPAIKQAITLANSKSLTKLAESYKLFDTALYGVSLEGKWTNPLDKYPLFDAYGFRNLRGTKREHFILYLNAAFAARKKGATI